jgi:NAD(P)H-hydrate epimerase
MKDIDEYILGIREEIDEEKHSEISFINSGSMKSTLKKRNRDSHKGTYGRVGVLSGSKGMAGAAVLNMNAALRCGSGLVKGFITNSIYDVVESMSLESITHPFDEEKVTANELKKELIDFSDVIATGSGCTNLKGYDRMFNYILENSPKPLVIDAEGINKLELNRLEGQVKDIVLTPHHGEMARLTGKDISEIRKDITENSAEFAVKHNVFLVLKGPRTLIACPGGQIFINTTGNPGMATAGSGDVLTGAIASFIGQGIEITKAVSLGVYVHGLAGDIASESVGEHSLIAQDIIRFIPEAIKSLA